MNFWLNLMIVMATGYIIIWYVFKPSDNQCQMTFMMEPPKFIPIPVTEFQKNKAQSTNGRAKVTHDDEYKLFMYSEFGFPFASDMRRDFKDSMPVIFVPGNAGSYQQVRSIASTCIRLQLQSLDAYKFIFYTIDFRGQFSGIDGKLIEEQTSFLHKSLDEVIKLHPSDTNGVILIGHSVGGFISKALFTRKNFNPNSVPLLISLASPLTSPYLNFDTKMKQLYEETHKYWTRDGRGDLKTLSLSINGGRSDHLVPMHLSIDETFDLSISTSSIKDVWLPSDHVSVTWCKELIHKLAHLLSNLMDKRNTHLIEDRNEAVAILKKSLLTELEVSNEENKPVIPKDWILTKPHKLLKLNKTYSAYRTEMNDNVIILDLDRINNNNDDVLVIIDHLGKLRPNSIYGCAKMEYPINDKQVKCTERVDLMHLSQSIPTRRFEAKKTAIKIKFRHYKVVDYLVIDFQGLSRSSQSGKQEALPEVVNVLSIGPSAEQTIYVPSLWEYLLSRPIQAQKHDIATDKTSSISYFRFKLQNLCQKTQIFSLRFNLQNCHSTGEPNEARILFYQGKYLSESFFPPMHRNTTHIDVKISAQPALSVYEKPQDGEELDDSHHLDFYVDATCESTITVELDLLDLMVNIIQRNLDKILVCATYFAYTSVIRRSIRLFEFEQDSMNRKLSELLLNISGFALVYFSQSLTDLNAQTISNHYSTDELNVMILICFLSVGTVSFLRFLLDRMTDLATITNNSLSRISSRITEERNAKVETKSNGSTKNGSIHRPPQRVDSLYLEWPVIFAILAGSVFLSKAFTSLAHLLFITRKVVILGQKDTSSQVPEDKSTNNHLSKPKNDLKTNPQKLQALVSRIKELVKQVGVLSAFAFIANIPSALLKLNLGSKDWTSFTIPSRDEIDWFALVTAASFVLIKLISNKLDRSLKGPSTSNGTTIKAKTHSYLQSGLSYVMLLIHLVCILPIILTATDIRYMSLTSLMVFIWLECFLISEM